MRLLDYFFAARPFLHLPIWSVYLVSLHYYQQCNEFKFGLWSLGVMICLSLMASGAYYVNQIYDYESDAINDKLGFLQQEYTNVQVFMALYILFSVVGALFSALVSKLMLVIFLQGLVFAWLYSAPPFRLKDRPLAGLLANSYCFGFLIPLTVYPPIGLYHYLQNHFLWPCYFFLTVASVHIMTTLPDREGDRAAGKRTIAVVMSRSTLKSLALLLMTAAAAVAWMGGYAVLFYLAMFSCFPLLACLLIDYTRLELLTAKLPLLLLTLVAGFYYPVYLLFIVALTITSRAYYRRRFKKVYPELA